MNSLSLYILIPAATASIIIAMNLSKLARVMIASAWLAIAILAFVTKTVF